MRKTYLFGLALVAMLVFSSLVASTASALSQWLANNNTIATALEAETKGLLLLDTLEAGFLVVAIDCNGTLDGTVGPGIQDSVTDVLNAAGEVITELGAAPELALECKVETSVLNGCGAVGSTAKVWVDNLSLTTVPVKVWKSEILLEGTTFLDDFTGGGAGKEPGYEVECSNGATDLCEGPVSAILTNDPLPEGGVLGTFTEATNESPCVSGRISHLIGEGLTLLLNGEALQVSDV
jgi:hypothetical protein